MAPTTKLSAIILNKETQASSNLKELLNEFGNVSLIGTTPKLNYGLELVQKFKPDIFFLDDKTYCDRTCHIIDELSNKYPSINIIITCSCEKTAIMSQKKGIPEHLISPFDKNKLQIIVDRIKTDIKISALQEQLNILNKDRRYEKVMLITKSKFLFVNPKQIISCEADSNYTYVTLLNKKHVLVTKSLVHFYEESLCFSQFIRISRSVVINKKYLTELNKSNHKCTLKADNKQFSFKISPDYYKILKNNGFCKCSLINENITSHIKTPASLNSNVNHRIN